MTNSAASLDEAFKALASAQRREVLHLLGGAAREDAKACCGPGEICACKLVEALGLAPSTISHHMTILKGAGLVNARKEGQWVYYSIDRERLSEISRQLEEL